MFIDLLCVVVVVVIILVVNVVTVVVTIPDVKAVVVIVVDEARSKTNACVLRERRSKRILVYHLYSAYNNKNLAFSSGRRMLKMRFGSDI